MKLHLYSLNHTMAGKLHIVACIMIFMPLLALSQNRLFKATNSNGEMGTCLFPEVDGKIIMSDVVNLKTSYTISEDLIAQTIDDYILGLQINKDIEVSPIIKRSSRRLAYKIEIGIGTQTWGLELWGTPLFSAEKNASTISFDCLIEVRDNKYRYTLDNFYTERNTLRGEARNDGESNVIHWQRVNSLNKEKENYLESHNRNKRETEETEFDYNSQIFYEEALYAKEYDVTQQFINGLKSLSFDNDFGDNYNIDTRTLNLSPYATNALSLQNVNAGIIGSFNVDVNDRNNQAISNNHKENPDLNFLMGIGANVYITPGNPDLDYEMAGAQEIIKQILIDNIWNVVSDKSQADFIIKYFVNLEGRDRAYIYLSNRDGSVTYTDFSGNSKHSSESAGENREVARDIYLSSLYKIAKKLKQGDTTVREKFPRFVK